MPDKTPPLSIGAQMAVAALTVLGCVGGWLIVALGGFHHSEGRRSRVTVFVDGPAAFVMAAIVFSMATIGVIALLRAHKASRTAEWVGACLVLLPPLAAWFAGRG